MHSLALNHLLEVGSKFNREVLSKFWNHYHLFFWNSTSNAKGDDESFYFHVMRFYIPQLAGATFERHSLGVGIFTMQGFE
eukprot:1140869-Ditylum_brightwellii.AAC.1